MQREIQIICGTVEIPNLSGFLNTVSSIASENDVVIQGLNADLIAGEKTSSFCDKKGSTGICCRQKHSKRSRD